MEQTAEDVSRLDRELGSVLMLTSKQFSKRRGCSNELRVVQLKSARDSKNCHRAKCAVSKIALTPKLAAKCSENIVIIISFDRSLSIKFLVEQNNLFCSVIYVLFLILLSTTLLGSIIC